MRFPDFANAIESDALRLVALHWNAARAGRLMPSWDDIKPAHIAAQLKFIWVYRYDRETRRFTGRLAGNAIEAVFGKSFRGTPMHELYRDFDYDKLHTRAEQVVREPALFRSHGTVFYHLERIGLGERIILPLGADGATGDGILGVTIFQAATERRSKPGREEEFWYPL